MVITYMQNGLLHDKEAGRVRLFLSKQLRSHMEERYQIHDRYLYLERRTSNPPLQMRGALSGGNGGCSCQVEILKPHLTSWGAACVHEEVAVAYSECPLYNKIFRDIERIKQIKVYPPEKGKCEIIVIYERADVKKLPDNGRYLSIDLGLHNLFTCYDAGNGEVFLLGRNYLSICHYYHKRIGRKQSLWYRQQVKEGIRYPKTSKGILRLYRKKEHAVKDYLHKMTRYLVDDCVKKRDQPCDHRRYPEYP